MKKILLAFFSCLFYLISTSSFAMSGENEGEWRNYIDGTVGKPAYYLYHDVINKIDNNYFKKPSYYRALDLGIGSGNESIDLVTRGWSVFGIDSSEQSNKVISERVRGLKGVFKFQKGNFENVQLNGFYDLAMAFYSLPFGNKNELAMLVYALSQHMQNGAIFAGNFFGAAHDFVKKGIAYDMNENEIKQLFALYGFKMAYFLNRVYDQRDFEGDKVHWDVFDFIAIKN